MRVAFYRQGFGAERPAGFGGMETQQAHTITELRDLGVDVIFDTRVANVVHVFGIYSHTLGVLRQLKERGKRIVLSTIYWRWTEVGHHQQVWERQKRVFREAFELADLLLPNARIEAEAIHEDIGTPLDKMRIVVNAVPSDIAQRAAHQVGTNGDGCGLRDYVLVVGRIETRKNIHRFLEAMAQVKVPLLFIGDCYQNAYYWQCYDLARRRPARTEFFAGIAPPALYGFMKQAKVVAQPSIYETPGLAVLEAAALGVPIAPTNRGTAQEYFGDDVVYLDPFDPASMRECIRPKLDRVEALRQRVLAKYTWRNAAEQTLAAYKEFMGADL